MNFKIDTHCQDPKEKKITVLMLWWESVMSKKKYPLFLIQKITKRGYTIGFVGRT